MTLPEHLRILEAESIYLLREVVAERQRPLLLYSIGKDSSVLLHLARKAFAPGPVPFPLLHIDTTWKFRDMIAHRDQLAVSDPRLQVMVHVNAAGVAAGISPLTHDPSTYTNAMKTDALKEALDAYRCDAAFGGARRDEEKSRAKERMVSVRDAGHRWRPERQRPELWRVYNTEVRDGQSLRVFPLSNWTELDVWTYIQHEAIEVVPLYFAAVRPVVRRRGQWIVVDDDRLPVEPGESLEWRRVRFRTLGCYPLTAAIESDAATVEAIVAELRDARVSERIGRLIDHDLGASMERKKQQGYF